MLFSPEGRGLREDRSKMATNTMDAIKKKMQAMQSEKNAALDKADQLEQKVTEQKAVNEKVCIIMQYITIQYRTQYKSACNRIPLDVGVAPCSISHRRW